MTSQVVVRRGSDADRVFVRYLGMRVAADSVAPGRNTDPQSVTVAFERFVEFVFGQSHVMLVAERDGVPVGFLLLLDAYPEEVTLELQAFVAYMAVEPALRRQGIGNALLDVAEREARAKGLSHIALMVTESNAPARQLYGDRGYATERRLLSKEL